MKLSALLGKETFTFADVKEVLAKANEEKSGDALAGICAASDIERIAAKKVLSELTLHCLVENPVTDYDKDEVTRIIADNLDQAAWQKIRNWTVSELREYILDGDTGVSEIASIRGALTGEMAAAVCKLMSNLDLLRASTKCRVVSKANTTLGHAGVLAARLQPNHPSDAVDGIRASLFEGLSFGVGDAVIGINPVYDTAESVERLLRATGEIIDRLQLPTQNCILSHLSTQVKAIENGAPAGLIFQSIAGTQGGNTAFGISIEDLKYASDLGKKSCRVNGGQYMYFETGQGSELSSRSHNGADQVTLEARCYALARQFNPFLVNDVVGFIGPEYLANGRQMIRAGLEDHFMAKLLGLPMGVDACYTNHMDADQNDLENLTVLLVAAGVNYFMGVPMGDDVMLSYQTTSYHDIASLRELMNCRPAPEFERWLEEHGIMQNGKLTKRAGDARVIADMMVAVN
ncbi:MAG: ethanolamine ammonia-lyase subunit EutB [Candidatus Obscuribacterales bacterium]|nr:ethanolamine ammonia-lyase subunit EutB [Candidatus Obscuribacterales bacterium]